MKKSVILSILLISFTKLFAENIVWGDNLVKGYRESKTTSIEHPARYAFDGNSETYWQLGEGETSGFIEFYQEESESFSGCEIDFYAESDTDISFFYEKDGSWLDIKYGISKGNNDGNKIITFSDDLYHTNRILLYVKGSDASSCKIREVRYLKRSSDLNYQKILPEKYTFNEKEYITIKADRLWNGLIRNEWYEPLWYIPWEIQNGKAGTAEVFPPYYGHPSQNGEIIWELDGEYSISTVKAYFLNSGRSITFEFWNGKEWTDKKEFRYGWQTGWNRIDINEDIKTDKIRITFPDGWEAARYISQIEIWGEGERVNKKTGTVICDNNDVFGKTEDNYKDDGRIWLAEQYNDGNLLVDENEPEFDEKSFTFDRMYQLEKIRIWGECSDELYVYVNDEWNPCTSLTYKDGYFEAELSGINARNIRLQSDGKFKLGEVKLYGSPLEDKEVQNEVWWPNEDSEVYTNNNDCIIGWTGDALTNVTLDGQYNPSRMDNVYWMPLYRCGGTEENYRIIESEYTLNGNKSFNKFIINTKGGKNYIKPDNFIGDSLITIDQPAGDIWTQKNYVEISGKYGNGKAIEVTVNGKEAECIDGIYRLTVYLEEGENIISVEAGSSDGRTQTKIIRVISDTQAPEFDILYPFEGEYIDTSDVIVSLDGKEDKGLWWKINNEEWEYEPNYIKNKLYTLEDNFYTFNFTACDRSGNISESKEVNFCVDITPPEDFVIYDNIDRNKYEWTNNTTPTISFSTNDQTSGIDHYECRIDDGEWITVTSPYKLPELEDGIHKIEVKAFDKAGNTTLGTESYGETANQFHYIKVDTVAPKTVVGLKALTGRDENGTHIIVTWTGDYDDENYQDYIISRNPSFIKDEHYITDRKPGSKEYFDIDNLTDGRAYTYNVKAVDRAGNIGDSVSFTTTAGFAVSKIEEGKDTFIEYENIAIDIPDGAFEEDIVEILVNEILPEQYGVESRNPLVSKIYSVNQRRQRKQTDGTIKEEITLHADLAENALITINYKESSIPDGFDEGNLKPFYYDDIFGRWIKMNSGILDSERNTLTFETNHFTDFSVQATKETQLTPQELQSADYNPFATKTGHGDINVSEDSGDVSTQFTEMILPGKNGLDLVIQRIYSTSLAGRDAASIKTKKDNNSGDESSEKKMEGDEVWKIGDGWRLNFPFLSWNTNELWIKDLNGQSVNVSHMSVVSDDTESFTFKDRLSFWTAENKEVNRTIRMENHEYNDTIVDIYLKEITRGWWIFSGRSYQFTGAVLYQKDGKSLVFDDKGRIANIVDSTGKNLIKFDYTDLSKIKITDSHNREIIVGRSNDNINSISTGNKKITYTLVEDTYKDQNDKENKRYKLESATDIGNRKWKYSYETKTVSSVSDLKDRKTSDSSSSTNRYVLLLTKASGVGFGSRSIGYKESSYSYEETFYGNTYVIKNDYVFADALSKRGYENDSDELTKENYKFEFKSDNDTKQNYVVKCTKDDNKLKTETSYNISIKDKKRISDAPEAIRKLISYEGNCGQSNEGKTAVSTVNEIIRKLLTEEYVIDFETETYEYDEDLMRPTKITVTRSEGTEKVTDYVYDEGKKGNVTEITITSAVTGTAGTLDYNNSITSDVKYEYEEIPSKPGMFVVTNKISTETSGTVYEYYKYDSETGNLTYRSFASAEEPKNRWSYTYDEITGELTKEETPEGVVTTYTYDYPDRLNYKITKKCGNYSSSNEYDFETGNLYEATDYDEYTATYTYDNLNRVISQSKSVKAGELYGSEGQKITEVKISINYNDDEKDLYTEITDEKGIITSNLYNNLGNLICSIQDKDGQKKTTALEYDNYGRPVVMYGPYLADEETKDSYVTYYEYDSLDRITSIKKPGNSKAVSYEYNDSERKTIITDESNRKSVKVTDWNDNAIIEGKFHYGDFIGMQNQYDGKSLLISSIDGNNNKTEYEYNCMGLETSRSNDDFTMKKEYDNEGRCKKEISGNGNDRLVTEYTYNALGQIATSRISTKVNNTGKIILTRYNYDGRGNKLSEVSGYADEIDKTNSESDKTIYKHEKSWTYDFRGNILSETDEASNTTKYTYDECGNIIKVIDPREELNTYDSSYFIQMEYDSLNRVVHAWIPRSGVKTTVSTDNPDISFVYDGRGNVTERKDPYGLITSYIYNSRNLLESEIKADGDRKLETKYTYDDSGLQLTITDASGLVSTNVYDDMGRATLIKQQDIRIKKYEYDGNGNITEETDGNGNVTERTYNINNQIKTESVEEVHSIAYEYYSNGLLKSVTDGENNVRSNKYDNAGRLISETSYKGTVNYEYDAWGNVINTTDLNGTAFVRTYTKRNQVEKEVATNGEKREEVSYEYDEIGNIKSITNQNGRLKFNLISDVYQSDPYNNIRGMLWEKTGFVTSYTYDSMNRLTSFTNVNGDKQDYSYNNFGQLVSSTGKINETLNWLETGLLGSVEIKKDEADILTKAFGYDELNRLSSYSYTKPAETSAFNGCTYNYDNASNMISRKFIGNSAASTYEYDSVNQLVKSNEFGMFEKKLDYSNSPATYGEVFDDYEGSKYPEDSFKTVDYKESKIEFDYGAKSVIYNFNNTIQISQFELVTDTYNKENRVTDKNLRLFKGCVDENNEITWEEIDKSLYKYEKNEVNGSLKFNFREPFETHYLKINTTWNDRDYNWKRLKSNIEFMNTPGQFLRVWVFNKSQVDEYDYNKAGNRIKQNETKIEYYKNSEGGDTNLRKYDGDWYYTYDKNGNRILKAKKINEKGEADNSLEYWIYTWDLHNRLIEAKQYNAPDKLKAINVTYEYDALNYRIIRKGTDGSITKYAYGRNGALVYEERTSSETATEKTSRSYVYINGEITGFVDKDSANKEEIYYTVTDIQGSVTEVLDSRQNTVWKSGYSAFGQVAGVEKETFELSFNGIYTGKDIDAETGLTYHWNRWRSEDGSVWLTPDPARDGENWWNYCNSNPMTYTDPLGLFAYGPDGQQYSTINKQPEQDQSNITNFFNGVTEGFNNSVNALCNFDFGIDCGQNAWNSFSNGDILDGISWELNGMAEVVIDFTVAYCGAYLLGACIEGVSLAATTGSVVAANDTVIHYGPINKGPLPESLVNTFRSGTYDEVILQSDTTLYRVYGGTASKLGTFWTRTAPTGPLQAQIDLALKPEWGNTAENVVKINVPAGTTIFEGIAASQRNGLLGGANQVIIQNVDPNWVVP